MKSEYSETIDLPATCLYSYDIKQLASLVTKSNGFSKASVEYSTSFGKKSICTENIDELLAAGEFYATDKLGIRVHFWRDREISASLTVTLYHNYAHCQLRAEDSRWLYGIKEEIIVFFEATRPWYSRFKAVSPFALFPFTYICFTLLKDKVQAIPVPALAIVMFCAAILIAYLDFSQKIFPYVRVYFRARRKVEWTPELTIATIGLLISFVALFVSAK